MKYTISRKVQYGPQKDASSRAGRRAIEWVERQDYSVGDLAGLFGITIKGTSLEPIACDGQIVLVGPKIEDRAKKIRSGALAVVESDNERVGNVVKRVFPMDDLWILTSPNPIDPHDPIALSTKEIRAVWPVRGVIFGS